MLLQEILAAEVEALASTKGLDNFCYGVTWLWVVGKLSAVVLLWDDAVTVEGEPGELPARVVAVIVACRDRLEGPGRN